MTRPFLVNTYKKKVSLLDKPSLPEGKRWWSVSECTGDGQEGSTGVSAYWYRGLGNRGKELWIGGKGSRRGVRRDVVGEKRDHQWE